MVSWTQLMERVLSAQLVYDNSLAVIPHLLVGLDLDPVTDLVDKSHVLVYTMISVLC